MEIIRVLSIGVLAFSSGFLLYQIVRLFHFDQKEVKSFQITNRKTGKQATMSVKPSKDEVKRVLDVIEH